ncbi:MAG: GNAT family N-acetyltransferase [Lachnospiraceae bacterium]|nr:GNAT family N-acetyltransferase [Lachnospiraceae bacterium]
MRIERLTINNADAYIMYLKKAMSLEPDMMTAENVDEEGIRKRMTDSFYSKTTSLLAFESDKVVGRIEYHFYGCMQDGYRMAYVDWVYVLPEYRHNGIAQALFKALEKDCIDNEINQYYLIRSTNREADRFYHSFEMATFSEAPILRREF